MIYSLARKAAIYIWIFLSACAVLYPGVTAQAAAASKAASGKVPTNITAARLDYNANTQIVVFSGNVHVKRPDFELWAAKMTIYLDKSGKPAGDADTTTGSMQAGDIDRIVAEKDVRMKSDTKQGKCDKATYFAKEDKFVMEGKPVLTDADKSQIIGSKIIHYMNSNRSEVLGAEAMFYTPDNSQKKGGRP